MAVELKKLYDDIHPLHEVQLLTESCFNKFIGWVHMVENAEFICLLHGDELVFNSSLNYSSTEERKQFIDGLIAQEAGGLMMALQSNQQPEEELIQYCNEQKFPLFLTGWETSFLNIMRRFSETLLSNERNETNLIEAFKNAIYYPDNTGLYLHHFERNFFMQNIPYVITIIGNTGNYDLSKFYDMFRRQSDQCIVYEEADRIIILTIGYSPQRLKSDLSSVLNKYPALRVGIGSLETEVTKIYQSYSNAMTAYQLTNTILPESLLCYDELGIYQLLCNLKNPETLCNSFVQHTLGKLISYDQENHSSYMKVLQDFFDNDCSIVQTAEATFFHQNTLKYKIKHIKEILGYDITTNENRTKIMLALSIMKLSNIEYLEE